MVNYLEQMEIGQRTIQTRDVVLSEEDMARFRVLGIFNRYSSTLDGVPADMELIGHPRAVIVSEEKSFFKPGVKEPMTIFTAIAFADKSSALMFVHTYQSWFVGTPIFQEAYN
jgi:hypothetical protein